MVELGFPRSALGTFTFSIAGVPVASNTLTATLRPSAGAFDLATGHIDIARADFLIEHSSPFLAGSTATVAPLTTRAIPSSLSPMGTVSGAPLNRSGSPGRLILVGSSVLVGGNYNGTLVDVTIDGVLSAFPPLP